MSDQVKYMFEGIDLSPVIDLLKNHDISGWFKSSEGGENLRFFQSVFAEYCNTKYAFATSSGSAAIYTALKACGIGYKDNVLVPAYTHIGSVAPIVLAGARPVFVDVDMHGNIDASKVSWLRAKAMIAVHMLGMPCEMDALRDNFKGYIIEDASHALGSEYKGKRAGSLGDIGAFSIGGGRTKTIGCGEGGMVTTNNEELAEKCKNIRNHGDRASDVDYFCFNFRMSELNALIGLLQMQRIEMLNNWQMKNAERIIKDLPRFLEVPQAPSYIKSVRYIIGCICPSATRQIFLKRLVENGWDGGMPRMNIGGGWSRLISDVKFYHRFQRGDSLKMSERLRDEAVWIDWHRFPRTSEEIDLMLKHMKGVIG